jgi:hypothetical protein
MAINVCFENARKEEQNSKVDGEGWDSTTGGDLWILAPQMQGHADCC